MPLGWVMAALSQSHCHPERGKTLALQSIAAFRVEVVEGTVCLSSGAAQAVLCSYLWKSNQGVDSCFSLIHHESDVALQSSVGTEEE
eukprot:6489772-Amphidinium_carterae.2